MPSPRFILLAVAMIASPACSPQQAPPAKPPLPAATSTPTLATPTPCDSARTYRARVPMLLQQGKLDRAVRVLHRADELCPSQQGESAALLASALAELAKGSEDGRTLIEAGLAAEKQGQAADAQRLFDRGRAALERAEGVRMTVEAREAPGMVTAWPRGDMLAEQRQGHVSMLLASTLEERLRLEGASGPLAFSPNGNKLASASPQEGTALLFDAVTGRELARLPGHGLGVESLRFSPDGTRLETRARDGVSFVWDVATGKELSRQTPSKTPKKRAVRARGAAPALLKYWTDPNAPFGPDEVVCDGQSKRCPQSGPTSIISPIRTIHSPDGSKSATEWRRDLPGCVWQCPSESMVVIKDVASGGELHRLAPCSTPVFSPDGLTLVSTGGGGFDDGKMRLWSVTTGKRLVEIEATSSVFSPDGARLAVSALTPNEPVAKPRIELYLTAGGTRLPSPAIQDPGKPRYVLTPEGFVDFEQDATRNALVCRLKQFIFPFEVCEERCRVPGLLSKVLSGDTALEP